MTGFDFVALIFAIRGTVDVWRNGSIFAEQRAVVEVLHEDPVVRTWRQLPYNIVTLWGLVWGSLNCSYCLTRSSGLLLCLAVCTLAYQPLWMTIAVRTFVYGIAAAELSWILNGLLPEICNVDRNQAAGTDDGDS